MSIITVITVLLLTQVKSVAGQRTTDAAQSEQSSVEANLRLVAMEALYEGVITLSVLGVVFGIGRALQGPSKKGKLTSKGKKMQQQQREEVLRPVQPASQVSKRRASSSFSSEQPAAAQDQPASSPPQEAASRRPSIASLPRTISKDSAQASAQDVSDCLASVVRSGQASDAPRLLEEVCSRLTPDTKSRAVEYLLSTAKACASRRCFHEALQSYDSVADDIGSGRSSLWSVLLYCAVEARDFQRCPTFFERMVSQGVAPSGHDFVNMVRYFVHSRDAAGILQLRATAGAELDELTRNRSLAVCASAGAEECAEALVSNGPEKVLDEVAYNTLMKCYMNAGQLERCLHLCDDMKVKGVKASAVTYGILLDACISMQDFDTAAEVFHDLQQSDLPLNTVLYTTFIKGLVKAGQMQQARDAVQQMRQTPGLAPDLVTYSTLLKAYSDQGDIESAMEVLYEMRSHGISPDLIAYNIVLSGCTNAVAKPARIIEIIDLLTGDSLKPSKSTLSLTSKAFGKQRSWKEAADVLRSCHDRFQMHPDPVHFLHLAQAATKCGDGWAVLYIFEALAQASRHVGEPVPLSIKDRMKQMCAAAGAEDAAASVYRSLGKPPRSLV